MEVLVRRAILVLFWLISSTVYAGDLDDMQRFQKAYPDFIAGFNSRTLIWMDGTEMPLYEGNPDKTTQEKLESPALIDQVKNVTYPVGLPSDLASFNPMTDPGRIRYEPFFRKMYGDSENDVRQKLVIVNWLPAIFGNRYPLLVTKVNGISDKIKNISAELEALVVLHPEYIPFLENPGTFEWRVIAATNRLSPHSFGMTIDINPDKSNYWQWDLTKEGKPISEDAQLTYRNDVPWEIVLIFEKYGYVWGGKWHHYDSMHFEYRPELVFN